MKQILLAAIFAVTTLSLASFASAQSLAEGMWTGTMIAPGGDAIDIGYEVKKDGDVMTVALLPPEGAGADADRFEFSDVRFEDGNLVFWWEPGPRIDCVLEPMDGGGYEGECTDPDGDTGILTMTPPGHDADGGAKHDGDDDEGHEGDKDKEHGDHD